MRRARRQALWTVLLWAAAATPAGAHELRIGVGTQSTFSFFRDHIEIELNFGVSTPEGIRFLRQMDRAGDDNGEVSVAEADAFLARLGPRLVEKLDLRVNGRPVELEITGSSRFGMIGRLAPVQFDTLFELTGKIPPPLPDDGGWWIHYHDGNHTLEQSSQFTWIRPLGHDESLSYRVVAAMPPEEIPQSGMRMIGRDLILFMTDSFHPNLMTAFAELEVPTPETLSKINLGPEWRVREAATDGDGRRPDTAPENGDGAVRPGVDPTAVDPAAVDPMAVDTAVDDGHEPGLITAIGVNLLVALLLAGVVLLPWLIIRRRVRMGSLEQPRA